MKKLFAFFFSTLLVLLSFSFVTNADFTAPTFFTNEDGTTYVQLAAPITSIGSNSDRIANISATTIDVVTAVIGGLSIGDFVADGSITASGSNSSVITEDGTISTFGGQVGTQGVQLTAGLANPAYSEGLIFYDDNDKTLAVYNNESDVTLQLGQEVYIRATNKTGTGILNGKMVYIDGAQGNRPTMALASSTGGAISMVIGMTTHDVADNATGFVTTMGLVNDIDTSSFSTGSAVYLSHVTRGELVDSMPNAPNFPIQVGTIITSNSNSGRILVNLGPTDVVGGMVIESLTINDDLVVSGSGLFTGNVGIGTATPSSKLAINGGVGTLSTGLTFGDGNSGFYESQDNVLRAVTGGTDRFNWFNNEFRGVDSNAPALYNEASSLTNPTIIPNQGNTTMGIGGASGVYALIHGSQPRLYVGSTSILLNQPQLDYDIIIRGDTDSALGYFDAGADRVGFGAASPSSKVHINGGEGARTTGLCFGADSAGNTCLYESASDVLSIDLGASSKWNFTGNLLESSVTNGAAIQNVAATGTVPTLIPRHDGFTTGIGASATNIVSVISAGNNRANFGGSEVNINDSGSDIDLRVEGVGQENAFFLQGSDGNIGFGTGAPDTDFEMETRSGFLGFRMDTATGQDINMYFTENGVDMMRMSWDSSEENIAIIDDTGGGRRVVFEKSGEVGIGTLAPDASSLLDITSTTKGMLPPRMTTTQRNAIVSPVQGLFLYNTDDDTLNWYDGAGWMSAGVTSLGEMFQRSNAAVTTINTINVWEEVNHYGTGDLVGFTFTGSGDLTASVGSAGMYLITASIGSTSAIAIKNFEFIISVDDVIQDDCVTPRKYSTTDIGSQSITCFKSIADGEVVKLEVRNLTDANNITIIDSNVNLHRL